MSKKLKILQSVVVALSAITLLDSVVMRKEIAVAKTPTHSITNTKTEGVISGTFGTAPWKITGDHTLEIGAGNFEDTKGKCPWSEYTSEIDSINITGVVKVAPDASGLFYTLLGVKTINNFDMLDTSNVTNMQDMFRFSGIKTLDLSHFDTSKVTNMQGMFMDSQMSSLDLSHFNTSKVTNMQSMFMNSQMSSLDLSSFDTSHMPHNGLFDMFAHCKLTKLETGPKTKLDECMHLVIPNTPKGIYTGKWQTLGTGTLIYPNGDWTGSTIGLIDKTRLGEPKAETFVAQRVHDYDFKANNITVKQSEVSKLDVVKASKAVLKDLKYPNEILPIVVKNNGGLTNKPGTYKIVLGFNTFPEPTKTVTVKVEAEAKPVTVQYVDEAGKSIHASQTITGNVGDLYDASTDKYKLKIDGFTLDTTKLPTVVKGTFSDKPQTVTYVYKKIAQPKPSPSADYHTLYRLYNKNTGEHLYTTSSFERSSLIKAGWNNEGVGWLVPDKGTPVYRLYNPNAKGGDHYYTASKFEAESLVKVGWKWDNKSKPVFYSGGETPVYVAYNPNAISGSHNYTTSTFEQKSLLNNGWEYGKVQFYGK